MKVIPTMDRVLIKRDTSEETSGGGMIFIPEPAREKLNQGVVRATGPGRIDEKGNRVPMEIKVGDRVLFGKYDGAEIEVEGEVLLFMREGDLLGVQEVQEVEG